MRTKRESKRIRGKRQRKAYRKLLIEQRRVRDRMASIDPLDDDGRAVIVKISDKLSEYHMMIPTGEWAEMSGKDFKRWQRENGVEVNEELLDDNIQPIPKVVLGRMSKEEIQTFLLGKYKMNGVKGVELGIRELENRIQNANTYTQQG